MITNEYAAGFFDGEGSVYAATRRSSVREKIYKNPTILVTIANTVITPLKILQDQWGGSICDRFPNDPRRRLQHQWVLAPRMADPFLRAIHPHLIIKKEVAGVALQYCDLMRIPLRERMDYSQLRPSKTPGKMTRAGVMRPEFREKIDALHAEIQRLNTRGAPFNATRKHTAHSAPGNPV